MQNNYRKIVNRIESYAARSKPTKNIKYKAQESPNHLTRVKKTIDYYYYICDYCGSEIKILNSKLNGAAANKIASGGTVILPTSMTKTKKSVTLALCNKCLNPVLQEFKQKEIEDANYSHIPRTD